MSKWIVPFVIVSIFVFTGLAIYLQFVTSVELSSTLILSFYGFCTGELWLLASIKKTKIKKPIDSNSQHESEIIEEPVVNSEVDDILEKIKVILQKEDNQ